MPVRQVRAATSPTQDQYPQSTDVVAPFAEGRIMAARIPGARMVALDSCNHLLLPEEPAWRQSVDEIRRFLRD